MTEDYDPVRRPTASVAVFGQTRDGLAQLRREWVVQEPRAVVVLAHGIAEHSGRYEHVGRFLTEQGYGVVGYDHRGFGQSGGRRSHVRRFTDYLDDLEDHLEQARAVDRPVVLCGHSMGGLIATAYAVTERPQPDYLVLSGPALAMGLPRWLMRIPTALSRVAPTASLGSPFDVSVLSRDERVGAAYVDDPLVNTATTLQLVAELGRAIDDTLDRLDRLRVPTLALHGGADELVPSRATEQLAGRPGVDTIVYSEARHEIFNELNWREVLGDLVAWLDRNLGR